MAIDPRVDIGPVHLHVHPELSDTDRALGLHSGVLCFELLQHLGNQALTSAGDYRHIGLSTWASWGAPPPPRNTTALHRVAIRHPDRRTLAVAPRPVIDAGIPLGGAGDHGVSEASCRRDSDGNGNGNGNGNMLYKGRPQHERPSAADGELLMVSARLDVEALLREFDAANPERSDPVFGDPVSSDPISHDPVAREPVSGSTVAAERDNPVSDN